MLRYFSSLPRAALDRLYSDGWACQGLLRALPSIARLYVMRLVMVSAIGDGLPVDVVDAWPRPTKDARSRHDHAIKALRHLSLLEDFNDDKGGRFLRLHRGFAKQLLDCMCDGSVLGAGVGGEIEPRHARAGPEPANSIFLTPWRIMQQNLIVELSYTE